MDSCDLVLFDDLRKGTHKAFEKIFHKYYKKLFNYIKEYVTEKEITREIVQETFLKLWEIRTQLKADSNISALLFTIARNNSLNYLKKTIAKKKYTQFVQYNYYQDQLNYIALSNVNSEQIIFNELQEKIESVIAGLPPKCKEIFELSRMRELKYKEIAATLNISVKTVENQISEALRRIRLQIQDYI